MPLFDVYTKITTVEAENIESAQRDPDIIGFADRCVIVEVNELPQPRDVPPSGKTCKGQAFQLPAKDGQLLYYRRCGWDSEIVPAQEQGDKCSACRRMVADVDIGQLEAHFCDAAQVLIPSVNIWKIVLV